MRMAERHSVLDEPFGDVGGEGETGRGFCFEAFLVEDHGADHAGERGKEHFQRVDLIEYGFLVFLKITRISGGQALQRGEQTGQIANETAGLASCEFRDIRVFLLRHDGRSSGISVVKAHEREFLGVPDDDFFRQPTDVDTCHGRNECEFGDQITAGGTVDGVRGHLGETKFAGHGHRLQAKGVAGEGTGTIRACVDALVPIGKTFHIAQQRPHVSHQLVCEQYRLGVLHVGAARHDGASSLFGLFGQCRGEAEQHFGDDAAVATEPHANQCSDLVVAGTAGAELASKFVSGNLQQSTFQCGGFVLIVFDWSKRTGIHTTLQLVESIFHALQLIGGQQSRASERTGMGA